MNGNIASNPHCYTNIANDILNKNKKTNIWLEGF